MSSVRTHRPQRWLFVALPFLTLSPVASAQAPANERPQANWELSNKFSTQALQRVIYSTTLTPRWIGKTDSLWYNWRNRAGAGFTLVPAGEGEAAALRPREAGRGAGHGAPEAVRA